MHSSKVRLTPFSDMSEVSSSKNRLSSTREPPIGIFPFSETGYLLNRQWCHRRSHRAWNQQWLCDQHEFVNLVLGAIGSQFVQRPNLAQHQTHLAKGQAMEQQRGAFDLRGAHLDGDVIDRDRRRLLVVQPFGAAPAKSGR